MSPVGVWNTDWEHPLSVQVYQNMQEDNDRKSQKRLKRSVPHVSLGEATRSGTSCWTTWSQGVSIAALYLGLT